jgi:hypothetical protein
MLGILSLSRNSTGDREMLEWTGAGAGARLKMLLLQDDASREYAYGRGEQVAPATVSPFSACPPFGGLPTAATLPPVTKSTAGDFVPSRSVRYCPKCSIEGRIGSN